MSASLLCCLWASPTSTLAPGMGGRATASVSWGWGFLGAFTWKHCRDARRKCGPAWGSQEGLGDQVAISRLRRKGVGKRTVTSTCHTAPVMIQMPRERPSGCVLLLDVARRLPAAASGRDCRAASPCLRRHAPGPSAGAVMTKSVPLTVALVLPFLSVLENGHGWGPRMGIHTLQKQLWFEGCILPA